MVPTQDVDMKDELVEKIEEMDVASQPLPPTDEDVKFDKEIEEAAIEEKEAKEEKMEMMSIIHTM